eukprot:TRINITY_DN7702_c0_g1_i1.p1 TRINITY_DN7702_c0_g1~~TRINITY_DN7702_c0_g1_i1.p1  ORF type:complete len:299 (-),score=101.36 TRINITY_DN7702_c0_g1_i1:13-909(-)
MEHLPIDIVLIRHGESEGNLAQSRSKKGDEGDWTQEFKERHTSRYRLTDKGRVQAEIAGKWVKENIAERFDRYYCSEYTRAMETASLLDMKGAKWFVEFYLRERDQGILAQKSHEERKKSYGEELDKRARDAFYWSAPGGESLANACLRVDRVLTQLREGCSGFRVVLVCHGNIMLAFRIRLERMKQSTFRTLLGNAQEKVHHCQILHYTRRNPVTGEIAPHINWMRSVCPWDATLSSNTWHEIERPVWTNTDLLEEVQQIPQLVNNKPGKYRSSTTTSELLGDEKAEELNAVDPEFV